MDAGDVLVSMCVCLCCVFFFGNPFQTFVRYITTVASDSDDDDARVELVLSVRVRNCADLANHHQ